MNDIKIFENSQFGQLRTTVDEHEEIWFIAGDVSEILGYNKPSNMTRILDDDEKGVHKMSTPGGVQPISVINESGFYHAVLQRRNVWVKDETQREFVSKFQRWVTHEVLPSIRKTGGYMITTPEMTPEEIWSRAILLAQDTINQQKNEIAELKPKAFFADAIALTAGINIKDWASSLSKNGVSISIVDAHKWLRDNNITYYKNPNSKHDKQIRAYQEYIDKGWFEYRPGAHTSKSTGKLIETLTVLITGEGQRALTPRILADFGVRNEAAV